MNIHEKYIKRCIELAKNGLGTTYPNPLVGSIIVHNDVIIGEGWHRKSGEPHAEVMAINSVVQPELLKDACLYVNLEPCSHFGKTPPCTELIISKGIKKVVIGTLDSNIKVCGQGVSQLEKNGCEVIQGVLEKECLELNKRFFTFHAKQRPFILLKWAQTVDGFIDRQRTKTSSTGPNWITTKASRQLVHKMRSEEQSILIGTNTALTDDPSLNVRDWKGMSPLRLIIDRDLKVPKSHHVHDNSCCTIFFANRSQLAENQKNTEYIQLDFKKEVPQQILKELFERQVISVMVEGGSYTLQQFIDAGLWDEAFVFTGAAKFSDGLAAPVLNLNPVATAKVLTDELKIYKNTESIK